MKVLTGLGRSSEGANDAEIFKMGGELGPRGETVFAARTSCASARVMVGSSC